MFRAARASDFEEVMRLYRQLHPDDPVVHDGSEAAVFDQILQTPAVHLYVLEVNGSAVATTYLNVIPNITRSKACGFLADVKTAYVARPS
jgi:hypothetical protein